MAMAAELKVGDKAPVFETQTDQAKAFNLESRKGNWTVLYFYPKADTPGCTKQACAFRDSLKDLRKLNADVYGVSADTVEEIAKFREKYHLNFTLLADPKLEIIRRYGVLMEGRDLARRWTFLIGPDLKIRQIEPDVDPVLDAERTMKLIRQLQSQS